MKNKKIINVIAVKGDSKRLQDKNLILLPLTLFWVRKNKEMKNTVVISDNDLLLNIAKKFGAKTLKEKVQKNGTELRSCRIIAKKYNADYIFNIPVTIPFRSNDLFEKFKKEIKKYDFLVSSRDVVNREIFFVEHNTFKTDVKVRRGASCKKEHMIDGALYLIKRKVLEDKRIVSDNVYEYFWSLNFGVIPNTHPIFLDIDEEDDLENLLKILAH